MAEPEARGLPTTVGLADDPTGGCLIQRRDPAKTGHTRRQREAVPVASVKRLR